jgi:hypothetical protein
MAQIPRSVGSGDDPQEVSDRQTVSLAGIVVALFLVVAGLYVMRQLAAGGAVERCLLAHPCKGDVVLARAR